MAKTATAKDLLTLLSFRHSKDIFVPECKNGPTHYASRRDAANEGLSRFDAWAMARSWSQPCFWAYEIKVSRGDFLQDEKWRYYLGACNEFYFVCPPKIIMPEEVPADAGLLWCSSTLTKLYRKKKAPHREIPFPEHVVRYVMHSRMRTTDVEIEEWTAEESIDYWRKWLETKKEKREIGRNVSRALREQFIAKVIEVENKQRVLEAENSRLQKVQEFLKEIGVDHLSSWGWKNDIIKATGLGVPKELDSAIWETERGLSELKAAKQSIESLLEKNDAVQP